MREVDEADVVVVGGGPTGLVLATLLGRCGCRTLLVERDERPYPVPRATHVDAETRLLSERKCRRMGAK